MDKLMLAGHIADAASFFDTVSGDLPVEARAHVGRLHDAAQIMAGDRVGDIYTPEDGNFKMGEHYVKTVPFGRHAEYPLRLGHWRDGGGELFITFSMQCGAIIMQLAPSPTQCRALAAALKQLAEDAESSAAQALHEQSAAISVQQAAGLCIAFEVD